MSFLSLYFLCYGIPNLLNWGVLFLFWKSRSFTEDAGVSLEDFNMLIVISLIPVANIFSAVILIWCLASWFFRHAIFATINTKLKIKYPDHLK